MSLITSPIGCYSTFSEEIKSWTIISALPVADLRKSYILLYFLTYLNTLIEFYKIVNLLQRSLENNRWIFSNETLSHVLEIAAFIGGMILATTVIAYTSILRLLLDF